MSPRLSTVLMLLLSIQCLSSLDFTFIILFSKYSKVMSLISYCFFLFDYYLLVYLHPLYFHSNLYTQLDNSLYLVCFLFLLHYLFPKVLQAGLVNSKLFSALFLIFLMLFLMCWWPKNLLQLILYCLFLSFTQ